MLARFAIAVLSMLIMAGCGQRGGPEKTEDERLPVGQSQAPPREHSANLEELLGAWFNESPLERQGVAIEFLEDGNVIETRQVRGFQLSHRTYAYSILPGGRINVIDPSGSSRTLIFKRAGDRLEVTWPGGATDAFKSVLGESISTRFDDALWSGADFWCDAALSESRRIETNVFSHDVSAKVNALVRISLARAAAGDLEGIQTTLNEAGEIARGLPTAEPRQAAVQSVSLAVVARACAIAADRDWALLMFQESKTRAEFVEYEQLAAASLAKIGRLEAASGETVLAEKTITRARETVDAIERMNFSEDLSAIKANLLSTIAIAQAVSPRPVYMTCPFA